MDRLILKPALAHQLFPTDGFYQVGVDPLAQLIEKLPLDWGQPLFPLVGTGGFE